MAKTAKVSKTQTSLRKSPKQERSKDLVDAVMVAATRILESTGVEMLTTNKVAKAAGVSIGSLYQYFPGKDAIFSKVIERQLDAHTARYRQFVEDHKQDNSKTILTELINDVFDLFYERRRLFTALFNEVPKLKKTREVLFRRNKIVQVFAELLKERKSELRDPSNVDTQLYVISHAILGVLQTAAIENFESQSPEVLKEELSTLAISYLLKPAKLK
jgi:AcrR family transcriptional regulator